MFFGHLENFVPLKHTLDTCLRHSVYVGTYLCMWVHIHICVCGYIYISMYVGTYTYMCKYVSIYAYSYICNMYECVHMDITRHKNAPESMRWLRLVGSPKTQVSFAKEPCKRDPFSAKETYILKKPTNHSHPLIV